LIAGSPRGAMVFCGQPIAQGSGANSEVAAEARPSRWQVFWRYRLYCGAEL